MADRKTIMLVFGTRPEAIKMAPVYRALKAMPETFATICCVTAQHRAMLDQVLDAFGIAPDIDLDLMRDGQDLTDITSAVLKAMRSVLREWRPDLVLVHGDTTTSVASALAAFYAGVPVAHVEAGLRSGSMAAPFPEELNRRVTGLIARYHFAPTEANRASLLAEGCDPGTIVVTGNTVVDAAGIMRARIAGDAAFRAETEAQLDDALGFEWRNERFVIVTCHRRENLVGHLHGIARAIAALAARFPAVRFLCPVHANPAAAGPFRMMLGAIANVHLVAPLTYGPFVHALVHCHSVLTDSGGLQEEAPLFGKPVLVMREVTERGEALAAGGAKLIGTDPAAIVAHVTQLLQDEGLYERMASAENPYGDGNAGDRIAAFLAHRLGAVDDSALSSFRHSR